MESAISPNVQHGRQSGFRRFLHKLNEQKYLQAMAIPGVIWMIIFNYIPMYGIIIAFKEYDITLGFNKSPWVGLANFKEFFADERFWLIIKNTVGISFFKLLVGFPLPILFAVLLNELVSVRFKRTVQTISYLPHFISWVVLGGILMNWLSETGLINIILTKIGILKQPIAFLAEPKYFWGITVVSEVWKELGWNAIIYLAAIAGIDPELYEAATVDGAGRFTKMFKITIPCISGTIAIMFILAVSGLMNSNFDQIFVLRNPLNADASDVIDIYVYRMGIEAFRFSYATAIGLFKSIIALILLLTANGVTKKLTDKSLF
ncbi:ABC transporter permease [Caldicellulosiruptor acetigenus]|uniref:ABC transporter permease n=1 Tax=Caldicellulosiruptor acetigenus TaxID=301953 RepID=UPI000424C2E2|nr:ABC transporter permease subunit [Caldicellulosiruptor acetigenus]WAM36315.1 ABC transporter permease subunit [Caldicellulosiruptor acetigenus]